MCRLLGPPFRPKPSRVVLRCRDTRAQNRRDSQGREKAMQWVKAHGHRVLAAVLTAVCAANGMDPDTVKAWLLFLLSSGTLAWSFVLVPQVRSDP